jgi:hypothetical protein
MDRLNKYPGICVKCRGNVEARAGVIVAGHVLLCLACAPPVNEVFAPAPNPRRHRSRRW